MSGKQMEGNQNQRRAAARHARQEHEAPSADQVTTGAWKQRRHLPASADHDEKIAARHEGKQDEPR